MKRCAVCDYLEGHGSHWLSKGSDRRKIYWNKIHNEYQCSECYTTIREVRAEQEVEDAVKTLEPETELPEGYDEVSEVPPALSGLPF